MVRRLAFPAPPPNGMVWYGVVSFYSGNVQTEDSGLNMENIASLWVPPPAPHLPPFTLLQVDFLYFCCSFFPATVPVWTVCGEGWGPFKLQLQKRPGVTDQASIVRKPYASHKSYNVAQ